MPNTDDRLVHARSLYRNRVLSLERVLEPRPTRCFRELDPEEYEKLSRMPGFLCFAALKPIVE